MSTCDSDRSYDSVKKSGVVTPEESLRNCWCRDVQLPRSRRLITNRGKPTPDRCRVADHSPGFAVRGYKSNL